MKIANDVTDLIGNTPLVRINTFSKNATILAKAEFLNPSHSVKDRIAWNIIKVAFVQNLINKDTILIEPTSGNTGVGLAMVAAKMGLKLILTMPSSMSIERQKLIAAFGAKIVLTDPQFGMKGAVDKANELAEENPNSFIPSQFDNPANPQAHYDSTGPEIWRDTDGKVDILVAGFGTGGTLSGTAKYLKEQNPDLKVIAVEPDSSPLASRGCAGSHKIQGIGANFIPKNLNLDIIDEYIAVANGAAFDTAKTLAQKEGLLVGISSGANVYAANIVANRFENRGKIIVTTLNDTGERYLSTDLFK
ncbi:cysteine synthase A [Campylobacter sp. JMF_01 NE2]|uniref:cysteine synthase A n=1 Tax=unclassified Campylobacter TaxID=2593542 RepID=UPI0022EA0218|nr:MULTISPECIES: cysteine synthase A [unclassified Campylobacter]MDA3052649.1 cysteine synthase A [Campylobacter sp. JMF_03 NE3]MDA3066980.1 cysteine synthase A [Campylobacter sp. JMF_01 NE2]